MLYTSVPLERIYHNFRENDKPKAKDGTADQKVNPNEDYKEVMLKHGRLVTKRDGDNYVIQKVYSTDMGDYLNDQYSPGKQYKEWIRHLKSSFDGKKHQTYGVTIQPYTEYMTRDQGEMISMVKKRERLIHGNISFLVRKQIS